MNLRPTGDSLYLDDDDNRWGTAESIAKRLTSPGRPVTAGMIRKWAWRSRKVGDRLYGMLPDHPGPGPRTGTTWYRLDHAARVEVATRRSAVVP